MNQEHETTAQLDRHTICEIGRLFWGDNKQCYSANAVLIAVQEMHTERTGLRQQQSDLSAAQKRIEEMEKDSRRLSWLLRLIHDKGTNGISDLPWTVVREDGEDSDVRFGRRTIDAAMHTPPTPP